MSLSTEDLDNLIIATLDAETLSLFSQGDAIIAGIENGHKAKYVYGRFAYLKRCSARTAYNRHKTRAIFDESHRNPALDWTFHYLCAQAADLRDPATWGKAYQWLDRAASLTSGNKEYSTADLALDMKQAGDDPNSEKPVYLLDKAEVKIQRILRGFYGFYYELVLDISPEQRELFHDVNFDEPVYVTIVQKKVKVVSDEAITS